MGKKLSDLGWCSDLFFLLEKNDFSFFFLISELYFFRAVLDSLKN